MLAAKRSAGVAPELNQRNLLYVGEKAQKPGIHPGLETQDRHHQESKTVVSVTPQKGLMFSKFFLKVLNLSRNPCMASVSIH